MGICIAKQTLGMSKLDDAIEQMQACVQFFVISICNISWDFYLNLKKRGGKF